MLNNFKGLRKVVHDICDSENRRIMEYNSDHMIKMKLMQPHVRF
jgi:hypothetical protein